MKKKIISAFFLCVLLMGSTSALAASVPNGNYPPKCGFVPCPDV